MDDDGTWAAVGALLIAFRARHVAVPRTSPLAPRSAGDTTDVPPLSLLEDEAQAEQVPAVAPEATAAAAVHPASAAEPQSTEVAVGASNNVFGALLDRLSLEADADGAEGPGTPGEGVSPARGSPLVRRWSARLSASMRKAGDELRGALDKL